MAHVTGVRGTYAFEMPSQQNQVKITPDTPNVFYCHNQTASSYYLIIVSI